MYINIDTSYWFAIYIHAIMSANKLTLINCVLLFAVIAIVNCKSVKKVIEKEFDLQSESSHHLHNAISHGYAIDHGHGGHGHGSHGGSHGNYGIIEF